MEQRVNPLQTNQRRQPSEQNRNAARQRTSNSGNASAQTTRTVGSTSNYGVARPPAALHVGDVLRGEITDLRNNEISITLRDNTVLRAQIPDSASYSIGQTGSFRLTDISGGTIYLENISIGYNDTELALINKALEKANLPATEHNQETVKALMDNLLPINRESIQNLMQQAYDYQTGDMNTLAVMNRLMMKMDADSVAQFSNYRNDNYELLERLQNFSSDLPSLLGALAENGPADAVAVFGKSLLSIGLSSSAAAPTQTLADLPPQVQQDIMKMLSATPMTEEMAAQLDNGSLSLQDTLTMLRDSALSGTIALPEGNTPATLTALINQINQILEPAATDIPLVTEDYVKDMVNANQEEETGMEETANQPLPLEESVEAETAPKAEGRFGFAGKFLQSISENARNLSDTLSSLRNSAASEPASGSISNPSIDVLTQTFEKFARSQDLLNSFLPASERNDLLNHLQDMPISRNMLLKIASGEASTKEVLTVINNTIGIADNEQIQNLFQSEVFQKLFARNLQSSWTMTPEQLSQGKLSEFYTNMRNQMQQYHNLIESTLSGSDSHELGNFAHDIESNLTFMKTLSQTFSYFQIPLKLPSQNAHSDLYVYSRKERLRQNPEKASVLLHLDMEHLGKIDIKLDKNKNDIAALFSLNDQESVNLFQVNADMLKSALQLQGYHCQMQVQEKEKPSPTVDDFINTKVNTHATTEMKRFSFDIRA